MRYAPGFAGPQICPAAPPLTRMLNGQPYEAQGLHDWRERSATAHAGEFYCRWCLAITRLDAIDG